MNKKILSMLMLSILILILKPLGISINQAVVIISLIWTIMAWVVGKPNKIVSSLFLLGIFILFGETPIEKVLSFPLSSNFLVIIFSFVFSQGIINSKLTEKLFRPFIAKYAKNVYQFLFTMVITVIILVFIIPQPLSRVILLSTIYIQYFESIDLNCKTREVLLLCMFEVNIIAHIFFKRGDIVLNNGILDVANIQMTEFEWTKNLMIPGLAMLTLAMVFFVIAFKSELKLFKSDEKDVKKVKLESNDKINLGLILLIIILWATENIHNISGSVVVIIGTILMYLRKIIDFRDFKSINLEVLVFLTAAFSIGTVMEGSGIADKIFGGLSRYLPESFSYTFVLVVMLSTMVLHMALGSSVTTMSVAIPSFISIAGEGIDPTIIMFLVFTSIVTQYLLPFHNVLLAVGEGNNYFGNKVVFRYGLYCTVLTFISVFLFFIPWWKFIGLI